MRPDDRYLELVHRLDRDTSGLILIASARRLLRELHRQLREKHVISATWPWWRADGQKQSCGRGAAAKKRLQSGERMVRVSGKGRGRSLSFPW